MKRLFANALIGVLLLAATSGVARADLFGATGSGSVNGELYTLNPANGSIVTDIGALVDVGGNHYGLTGLVFDTMTGVFYGSTANGSPTDARWLVTVNPLTGLVTPIGNFGTSRTMSDLAFDPTTGNLYGVSGGTGGFYVINPLTGVATSVGATGLGVQFGGGLQANSAGTIYNTDSHSLYTENKTTGAATLVAALTGLPLSSDFVNSLAFDSADVLYGVNGGGFGGGATHLITINAATGAVTDLGVSVNNLDALAFIAGSPAAVPEPSTVVLLGPALGGLIWRIRRSAKKAAA